MIDFAAHRAWLLAPRIAPGRTYNGDGALTRSPMFAFEIINERWQVPLEFVVLKGRNVVGSTFWRDLTETFPSMTWTTSHRFVFRSAADCVLLRLMTADGFI